MIMNVMKFLLDVNASGSLAAWLIELGHDACPVWFLSSEMQGLE
jgi:hypothetical protein